MSKYNNMKSIVISNLSDSERNKAIKQWAEGNKALEILLQTCYSEAIETTECHAGIGAYIAFRKNNSDANILKLFNRIQYIKNTEIFISPDGGNPFGGDEWYKPGIAIGCRAKEKNEISDCFYSLNEALLSSKEVFENEGFNHLLSFHDFFAGKNSCLNFRVQHTQEDKYVFSIELFRREKAFEYCNDLFQKAGLQQKKMSKNLPVKEWAKTSETIEEFNKNMKVAKECILENYSLQAPNLEELINDCRI